MLTSFAFIFLIGLGMASLCQKIKVPRIIGMLFTGIILGPSVLDLLDGSIIAVSSDLRKIALLIILIKAGLSLNISDLKKVGRPAMLMSFLPAVLEIGAYLIFAPLILGVTRLEAAIIGAVLAAVSPAVVVPKMVQLIEEGYGTNKSIPQLIFAGASVDDVVTIVLFTTFIGIGEGGERGFALIFNIPVSIAFGIMLGCIFGVLVTTYFDWKHNKSETIDSSTKVIVILGLSFLLMAIEQWHKDYIAFSGLLAVISMACVIKIRSEKGVSDSLSEKFGKFWVASEILLFVLVGAAVDIRYTMDAGFGALIMIFIGLAFRCVGVCLCLIKTSLNKKERLFCVIAYIPKATVQAAMGSVPLTMGLECGNIVLSMAVVSILICAPIGAFGMELTYKSLLEKSS